MFFDRNKPKLPSYGPVATGPQAGFIEGFEKAYLDQVRNNSFFAVEAAFLEEYEKNIAIAERLTGKSYNDLATDTVYVKGVPFQKSIDMGDLLDAAKFFEGKADQLPPSIQRRMAKLQELSKAHPGIKTLESVWAEVKAKAAKTEAENADAAERGGIAQFFGSLAGGIVGSFTWRDPVNLATLGIGGFGKTLVIRILTEAGVNSAIETINQFTGVQSGRELLGLESGAKQALTNIAFAGAGAAALRGGFEGSIAGAKRLYAGLSRSQLLKGLRARSEPTVNERAAAAILEAEESIAEVNPYGRDPKGEAMHQARVLDTAARINRPIEQAWDEGLSNADEVMSGLEPTSTVREMELADAEAIVQNLAKIRSVDPNVPASLEPALGYRPVPLAEFVAKSGGIVDEGGELSARDVTSKSLPGLIRNLTQDSSLDAVRERVFDAGYFPGTTAYDEISDIGGELSARGVSAKSLPGLLRKLTPDSSVDAVRERVFDAGYFPDKAAYDEITDTELADAIANDLAGERVYDAQTREQMVDVMRDQSFADEMAKVGITPDSSVDDVLEALTSAMRRDMDEALPPVEERLDVPDDDILLSQYTKAEVAAATMRSLDELDIETTVNRQWDDIQGERRQDEARRRRVAEMSPEEMRKALHTDELTGIPNRRAYEDSDPKPVQAIIDMDNFKAINDDLGHDIGDEAIKAVGKALQDSGLDAYRIGGDEFVVQGTSVKAVKAGLDKVRAVLEKSDIQEGGLRLSYGVARGTDRKATLKAADEALAIEKAERKAAGLRTDRDEPSQVLQDDTRPEVNLDEEIPVGVETDEFGNVTRVRTMRLGDALDEIKDDEALIEAMTRCRI